MTDAHFLPMSTTELRVLCVQGNCFHMDGGLLGHIMALAPDGWFQAQGLHLVLAAGPGQFS